MIKAPIKNLVFVLFASWLCIVPNLETIANENTIILMCPKLFVDVSTQCLRPCQENTYTIKYCNLGDATAVNAIMELTLDKDLVYISSTISPITQNGNELTFDLNDIPADFCGTFEVITELSCEVAEGAAHCVEAEIFPNEFCDEPSTEWDESSLQVTTECENDSIFFQIQNVGDGNMDGETQFFIVIDDLIVMLEAAQLNSGQSIEFGFPANQGSTFYAEIGQSDFHPGVSFPSSVLEGCPTDQLFTVGFLTQFPEPDQNLFNDITCLTNTFTCPTVEKIAFPEGFTDDHFINQNQSIEYQINFTNSTTEIQENLVICDTLSPFFRSCNLA